MLLWGTARMLLQIVWLCCFVTTVLCLTRDNLQEENSEYLGIAVEPDYIILVPQKNCKNGERRDFFGNCRPVLNSSSNTKKISQKEKDKGPTTREPKRKSTQSAPPTKNPIAAPRPIINQERKFLKPFESVIYPNITLNISEISIGSDDGMHIPTTKLSKINISSIILPPVNISAINTSALNLYNISMPVINSAGTKIYDIILPVINASAVNVSDIGLPLV